jgi:SAM-dependent methyltransferase
MTDADTGADAQAAEFGTFAEWTAEAARLLGRAYYVPAGCRGSGGPPALEWLLDRLRPSSTSRMLDIGAGVGGAAGYAAERTGVRPVLVEPQAGACRAARRLFGLDVVRGSATALPFGSSSFDIAWSLGVLDTLPDHEAFFAEAVRCLAPGGTFGLLAYTAVAEIRTAPEGNVFPTVEELAALIGDAGLHCAERAALPDLGPTPADWDERVRAVDAQVERRHHDDPLWQQASEQEQRIATLLREGRVRGLLYILRTRRDGS